MSGGPDIERDDMPPNLLPWRARHRGRPSPQW